MCIRHFIASLVAGIVLAAIGAVVVPASANPVPPIDGYGRCYIDADTLMPKCVW